MLTVGAAGVAAAVVTVVVTGDGAKEPAGASGVIGSGAGGVTVGVGCGWWQWRRSCYGS